MKKSILLTFIIIAVFATIVLAGDGYIDVLYPNGGEEVSETINVKAICWNTTKQPKYVDFYYLKGDVTEQQKEYIESINCGKGETVSVGWDTAQVEDGSDYKIQAVLHFEYPDEEYTDTDESDDFFTVDNTPEQKHFDLKLLRTETSSKTYFKPPFDIEIPIFYTLIGNGEIDKTDFYIEVNVYWNNNFEEPYSTFNVAKSEIINHIPKFKISHILIQNRGRFTVISKAVLYDDNLEDPQYNNEYATEFQVL